MDYEKAFRAQVAAVYRAANQQGAAELSPQASARTVTTEDELFQVLDERTKDVWRSSGTWSRDQLHEHRNWSRDIAQDTTFSQGVRNAAHELWQACESVIDGRKSGRQAGRQLPSDMSAAPGSSLGRSRIDGAQIAPMVDMAAAPVRPTYAALFGRPQPAAGEETFSRFLNAVSRNDTSYLYSRPRAAGAATIPGDAGGFAVPTAVSSELLELVIEQSQFLSRCRVVPMTAKTQSYPVLNIRDRSKGPAKFEAKKVAEGAAASAQTPAIEEVNLTAHKTITYWTCTRELLDDSMPGTDRALIQAAAGAIAMQLDREIWSGTGASQMLGIGASPAAIVSAKDSGQTAATVTYSNLTGMLARLLPTSWKSAVWFVSQTALPQLFGVYHPVMNSTNVVGGLPAPLTQAADGSYRLFGLPLVVTDFAPVLGAAGDVSLVDFSWYLVGMREQLRIELSTERHFEEDKVAFKVVQRRDGLPILPGPITPAVGSTTISPLVQLEARG